jgi:glycosyltransferase involved in cell wall biosynthesis
LKILAVRAKLDGVGHYRVSIPALALRGRGHTVDILDSRPRMRVCNKWFAGYDVCILQNLVDPGWVEVINTIPEEYRPVTVGCIDDLVDGLDETNPLFEEYRKAAPKFLECMSLCDGMVFSTERLAQSYSRYNLDCCVAPNCLDIPGYRDWDTPEGRSSRLTVGWLGGTQHVKDEEPMREGLRRFLQFHPEVLFAFCGNKDLGTLWKRSIGIPDKQWKYLKPTEFDGYQTRISHFDIGVAPLRETEFNRCKSDLRLLEYGAWGVPYVASDITPYRGLYEQSRGVGGALAGDAREWEEQLTRWAKNATLREKEGMLLKSWVREHRGHYACGEIWEKALSKLINRRADSDAGSQTTSGRGKLDAEYK